MEIINLRGVLVDIPCKISSDYQAYVTRDKRGFKKFLIRCQNALYSTMVAIIIYYLKLTNILTSIGFDINKYDQCISNKAIDGSHMTIGVPPQYFDSF